jgi:hypothetical protein
MNIRYLAGRTSTVEENLVHFFYWKIAKLKNCKIGWTLNFDVFIGRLQDCKIESTPISNKIAKTSLKFGFNEGFFHLKGLFGADTRLEN